MDEGVRIAFEAGLPFTGLRDFRPDERLWRGVAPDWALRERVVPLVVVGDRLKLAAARPDADLSAIQDAYAGVDLVIAPADEIDAALGGHLGLPVVRLAEHDPDPAGLLRLGLPVPLPATGVVARRAALDALGGWDPESRAPSAHLGLRLRAAGLAATVCGVEVAAAQASTRAQRARWWRGTGRAWVVAARRPRDAIRRLGRIRTAAAGIVAFVTLAAAGTNLLVLGLARVVRPGRSDG